MSVASDMFLSLYTTVKEGDLTLDQRPQPHHPLVATTFLITFFTSVALPLYYKNTKFQSTLDSAAVNAYDATSNRTHQR